jgi:TPR repeat protein
MVSDRVPPRLRGYQIACTGGRGMGCSNLGGLYAIGEGVERSYAKARELFAKGCELDDGGACYNLGALYGNGMGVSRDDAQKRKWMAKACSLGVQQACSLR